MAIQQRALITGITGQDGSYLAEYLLNLHYAVGGFIRSSSTGDLGNAQSFKHEVEFFRGDLADAQSIQNAIQKFRPTEIYNLGAEAAPFDSFQRPVFTSDVNALGALRVFEAAKKLDYKCRIYQASTSEMFGTPVEIPQTEKTPFRPNNPYGVAKLFAHHQARILREGSTDMFICCGILFNHESPRRGMQYVTRKISVGVACIKNKVSNPPLNELGKPIINRDGKLEMGNLEAQRDWGYAFDYVRAMHIMLQQDKPDDYIIATGETHSVKEFLIKAFAHVDLNWEDHIIINPNFYRPLETTTLTGNATKAKVKLDWQPHTTFDELVNIMVDSDLAKFG